MYVFAVVALLALATLKLVDFLTDAVPQLQQLRSLLTFVIGVGATVLLDYSVFRAWGIGIRNATVGTWTTGFIVAGMTVPWRAAFAYLTHDRATGDETLTALVASGKLHATTNVNMIQSLDCLIICVPTPLEPGKRPNITFILSAAADIARNLRRGQLVVLESTTYPGTTEETLLPMFEATGLTLDGDFLLAFSPERVDPGNPRFKIADIPKIVGGCSPMSSSVTAALYRRIVTGVHVVSSPRVAETAKLWENTFRAVNIGLANEMSLLCHHLGLETAEVIEAAATKPFGFMAFYPGPGVGGHCIPFSPHYLSWTATKYGYNPRFIMLAEQINSAMPEHVVQLVSDALNQRGFATKAGTPFFGRVSVGLAGGKPALSVGASFKF